MIFFMLTFKYSMNIFKKLLPFSNNHSNRNDSIFLILTADFLAQTKISNLTFVKAISIFETQYWLNPCPLRETNWTFFPREEGCDPEENFGSILAISYIIRERKTPFVDIPAKSLLYNLIFFNPISNFILCLSDCIFICSICLSGWFFFSQKEVLKFIFLHAVLFSWIMATLSRFSVCFIPNCRSYRTWGWG